jgi:hypothetical protein
MASPFGPIAYAVTQPFGPTGITAEPAFRGFAHYHLGIDMAHRSGGVHPRIYVTSRQQIYTYGTDHTDGANYVVTSDGRGRFHAYWHLNQILCPKVGTWVDPFTAGGVPIGTEGQTGNADADHLHYEVQLKYPYGSALHTPNNPIDGSPFINDTPVGGTTTAMTLEQAADLYLHVGNRTLNLGTDGDKALAQQKADFINGGGSLGQLVDDIAGTAQNYFSASRVVDLEYAYGGYDPGSDVKSAKAQAIQAGLDPVQLLTEIVPKPAPAPETPADPTPDPAPVEPDPQASANGADQPAEPPVSPIPPKGPEPGTTPAPAASHGFWTWLANIVARLLGGGDSK